jgi:hypothetical protein
MSPVEAREVLEPEVVAALEINGPGHFETRLRQAQDVLASVEASIGDRATRK